MTVSRGTGNDNPEQQPSPDQFGEKLHDFFIDLGVQAERSKDPHAALEFYQNAVKSQPESALAWYNLGDILLGLKRYEEAVEALERAIQLAPGIALCHYDLGLALFELGRYEQASKAFGCIVERDPELKRAASELMLASITNLALCQQELGHIDEAVKTLAPARRTAVNVLYNLGRLNALAMRLDEALPLSQAAAALSPDSEDFVHWAGGILQELKRDKEAIDYLQRTTRLNPRCTEAWHDLGVSYARLKRRAAARKCFNKALRQKPDYASAYYGLACLDAVDAKRPAAFRNLKMAVAHGFNDVARLRRDPDLRNLRRDPRWKGLLAKLPNAN